MALPSLVIALHLLPAYCTWSVTRLEWLSDCAVAVTTSVYVPAGVPLFVPGEMPPPPPPPPQAAAATQTSSASSARRKGAAGVFRRDTAEISSRARRAHPSHTGSPLNGRPRHSLAGGCASDRAVVCTVRVAWAEPEAEICRVEEEKEHVVPLGAPLQASETGMANPLTGVTVSVYFAACPASIDALAGVAVIVKF